MKRTIIAASIAALPILLGVSAVRAEPPEARSNIDASKMPESGPLVVGGTGQTTGPNSKNQAITPMPGLEDEELSERPPESTITTPEVRPSLRLPQPRR
jgi:hypothetical protein